MNDLRIAVIKAVRAPVPPSWIRSVLAAALTEREVAARARELLREGQAPELTVRITGDRELRRLNRSYLGEDHATDVLSFPSGVAGESGYLGDVALSWPAVLRQAAEFGHSPEVEASLLCVHGLLHVLGWDHGDPAEEREMTGLALRCLVRAGIRPARGRL